MAESAAEKTARSRRAQGLPPTVEDPATLDRLALLLSRRPASSGSTSESNGDGEAA